MHEIAFKVHSQTPTMVKHIHTHSHRKPHAATFICMRSLRLHMHLYMHSSTERLYVFECACMYLHANVCLNMQQIVIYVFVIARINLNRRLLLHLSASHGLSSHRVHLFAFRCMRDTFHSIHISHAHLDAFKCIQRHAQTLQNASKLVNAVLRTCGLNVPKCK